MTTAEAFELRELAVQDVRVPSLGDAIRRARERKGLTQPELGQLVGVAEGTISNWERGTRAPRNRLGRLLEVLDLTGEGDEPAPELNAAAPDVRPSGQLSDAELAARVHADIAELTTRLIAQGRPGGGPKLGYDARWDAADFPGAFGDEPGHGETAADSDG